MKKNRKQPQLHEIVFYIQARNEPFIDLPRFRSLMSNKYNFNKQDSKKLLHKLLEKKLLEMNKGNKKLRINNDYL